MLLQRKAVFRWKIFSLNVHNRNVFGWKIMSLECFLLDEQTVAKVFVWESLRRKYFSGTEFCWKNVSPECFYSETFSDGIVVSLICMCLEMIASENISLESILFEK